MLPVEVTAVTVTVMEFVVVFVVPRVGAAVGLDRLRHSGAAVAVRAAWTGVRVDVDSP
ncbi:hypothetical protein ACQEVC_31940 [Plantactinospora sp. CA-294935]|uniref:hypothetical protein n=1 Tax=Plantactinospora sp. CA-294935 TaxID=3240012 RepID=UPI003D8AC347